MTKVTIKLLNGTKDEFWAESPYDSVHDGRICLWALEDGKTLRSYPVNVILSIDEYVEEDGE